MPDIYTAPGKEKKESREKKTWPRTTNHLAAFVFKPRNIRFETQEKQEQIILLLRRHWMTNVPRIFLALILIAAPSFFSLVPGLATLMALYGVMVKVLWYLFTFAFILETFLSWYFNVNIVTDERIVDIDFYSLIYKEISHCQIDKIQDITFTMGGVARILFNYGNVIIQTAGEIPVFEFEAVPRPDLVVKKLNELLIEEEQEKIEGRVR